MEKKKYEFTVHSKKKGELICGVQNYTTNISAEAIQIIEASSIIALLYHDYDWLSFKYTSLCRGNNIYYYAECYFISANRIQLTIYDNINKNNVQISHPDYVSYWHQFILTTRQSTIPAFLPTAIEFHHYGKWKKILGYFDSNGFQCRTISYSYHLVLQEFQDDFKEMFDIHGSLFNYFHPVQNEKVEHEWFFNEFI